MGNYVSKLREKMGSQKLIIPGVRAIILNDRNEILLQKRGDLKKWGLPSGSVELGESAFDALGREIREETGLEVIAAKPMGIYSDPKYCIIYPNGDEIQIFTLAFVISIYKGRLKIDGKETLALKYFPMWKLPDDILEIHSETIQDYIDFSGYFILK